jgi:hypothetical protein
MSSNKTAETSEGVENFINAVDNEQKRKDSKESRFPAPAYGGRRLHAQRHSGGASLPAAKPHHPHCLRSTA